VQPETAATQATDTRAPRHDEDGPAGRIVIAGGTGFIGRALCGALAADGHDVVVLSRRSAARVPHARTVHWDPESVDGPWVETLRNAQAVVNLCGSSIAAGRWTQARKRELVHSRVRPARALLQAIADLDQRPERFLQASGVGYVGTGDKPTDESTGPGNDFLARLAIEWEATLEQAPVPTTALRFGVVLGHGGALPPMLLPFKLWFGGPVASGRQWLSWIHIDDAVAAIRFAIVRRLDGPLNLTAPAPVRNREFATTAGRVLHRPAWLPLPALALRLALGEQATLLCDGQHAAPARLLEAGFRFRHPTLESALLDLCR